MSIDMKANQSFYETTELTDLAGKPPTAVPYKPQLEANIEAPNYFANKALMSQILGIILLIPATPLIVLLAIIMRCTSPGPGLFKQTRVGRWGQEFTMYKIRTMFQNAEKASGPVWCRPSDSRITCFGRLLRFLHLDELPQLINIARGEMDLIGPRPERPEFVDKLVRKIPDYAERLAVLPGVTGLAQINLPPDETTDCVRRKLVLDIEYIETASWGLDLRILICTVLRMVGIRHGHAVNLLKLARSVPRMDKHSLPSNEAEPYYSDLCTPGNGNGQALLQEGFANEKHSSSIGSIPHLTEPPLDAQISACSSTAGDPLDDIGLK